MNNILTADLIYSKNNTKNNTKNTIRNTTGSFFDIQSPETVSLFRNSRSLNSERIFFLTPSPVDLL